MDINDPLAMIDRVEILRTARPRSAPTRSAASSTSSRATTSGTDVALYTGGTTHRTASYDASFVTGHSSSKGNIVFSAGFQQRDRCGPGSHIFQPHTTTTSQTGPSMRVTPTGAL